MTVCSSELRVPDPPEAGALGRSTSVLTLLRNPVYVGQVYFRGALHPAPHEHLVEVKLFDRVHAMLSERGEDYSKRGLGYL